MIPTHITHDFTPGINLKNIRPSQRSSLLNCRKSSVNAYLQIFLFVMRKGISLMNWIWELHIKSWSWDILRHLVYAPNLLLNTQNTVGYNNSLKKATAKWSWESTNVLIWRWDQTPIVRSHAFWSWKLFTGPVVLEMKPTIEPTMSMRSQSLQPLFKCLLKLWNRISWIFFSLSLLVKRLYQVLLSHSQEHQSDLDFLLSFPLLFLS